MQNFPRVIGVGRGARRNRAEVIPGRDSMGIGAAYSTGRFGGNPARSHGAIFAANALFAEFTVRSLGFDPVFPRFSAGVTSYLFKLGGFRFHHFNGGKLLYCIQFDPPIVISAYI
jgi:hypothetical protein